MQRVRTSIIHVKRLTIGPKASALINKMLPQETPLLHVKKAAIRLCVVSVWTSLHFQEYEPRLAYSLAQRVAYRLAYRIS